MKTKKLLTTLAIASVVLIAGCKKDDFVEVISACPFVESTNPTNASSGVSLNRVITVTFNEKMNPATIIESCNIESPFTLQGTTPVAGTVSYNGKTATFTPSGNLLPGTTYTAIITTRVKNLAGIPLAKSYVWSFSTVGEASGNIIFNGSAHVKK